MAKLITPEVRSALYYRFHFLWPWLARNWVRRGLAWLGWGLLALYFLFVALVLILRYGVLPEIHRYQGQIEVEASRALGLPVKIGHLAAHWQGLNPALSLENVQLMDAQGAPALSLPRVEGVLSWRSLWHGQPLFSLLQLEHPALNIRRDPQGQIFVAGISTAGEGDPRRLQWVLDQSRIRILDATVVWEDEQRGAAPLVLEDLQFELDNRGRRHRFGLSGLPPIALASRLDLRGDLQGRASEGLAAWEGQLYTRLDYADLAAWQAWVDYPMELPRGRGGIQLWADWENGAWHLTSDLVLEDLRLRLAKTLPELDLQRLQGRLELRHGPGHLAFGTRKLSLETRDGIRLEPLDLDGEWKGESGQPGQGFLKANDFTLDSLAALAAYLPLDVTSRELLERHRPKGRVQGLAATWDARGGAWKKYSLQADFHDFGLAAVGVLPGAQGLSGQLEASEAGGKLSLDSRTSSLDLPAVFVDPEISLDRLLAQVSWKTQGTGTEVNIERLDFAGPHATGQVGGTYLTSADGPGIIDLKGSISKADGRMVWRYIPRAVNQNVRDWLQAGILTGTGGDAKLILRGNLKDFPFRDPATGQFLITAKAQGVRIHYADGWPDLEGVGADMSFGVGMRVEAHTGSLLGARLGPVTVEIPDFDVKEELLLVKGVAAGPTVSFLRFIEQSPVALITNHFTEGMSAQGNGHLDLSLELPLRQVDKARIKGAYQFENNQISFVPGLPAATGVNGRLEFTEGTLSAQNISGNFLGFPMKLSALSEDGAVSIKAAGGFTAKELRRLVDVSLFDHLSGGAPWQAEVKVRKKSAELLVDSSLVGLSSSLPPPFNKSASDSLPFHLSKMPLEDGAKGGGQREQIHLNLGKVAEALLIRRRQGDVSVLERGSVGVGDVPKLPDSGLSVFVNQDKVNLDLWRKLMEGSNGNGGRKSGPPPISLLALQTGQLTAFGRAFNEVSLRLRPDGTRWRILLAAREAVGELTWDSIGQGMVTADLKRLRLLPGESVQEPEQTLLDTLPGMDVKVGDFMVGERRFGRLELKAENGGGRWNLRRINIENPDGNLTGSGVWETAGSSRTHLDFNLYAKDAGGLLGRLGYPGMVKGGTARLQGNLDWAGAPVALDPASLGGKLQLDAAKGQFAKVEPGVGKLLGLLSLQSITRRLTLDFRDIYSDGFAFDSINGKMNIRDGVMQMDGDLRIEGPAGKALMQGTVDMKHEGQDLLVTVQPEVGGLAAVGAAMAINPVVGAAALVAQTVLQNPLNKAFGFQYRVTGSWSSPQVDKVGSKPAESVPAPAGSQQ